MRESNVGEYRKPFFSPSLSLTPSTSSECILINPNIATIQTSHQMASEVYCESRRVLNESMRC